MPAAPSSWARRLCRLVGDLTVVGSYGAKRRPYGPKGRLPAEGRPLRREAPPYRPKAGPYGPKGRVFRG